MECRQADKLAKESVKLVGSGIMRLIIHFIYSKCEWIGKISAICHVAVTDYMCHTECVERGENIHTCTLARTLTDILQISSNLHIFCRNIACFLWRVLALK